MNDFRLIPGTSKIKRSKKEIRRLWFSIAALIFFGGLLIWEAWKGR
jgi:hypothetical protein